MRNILSVGAMAALLVAGVFAADASWAKNGHGGRSFSGHGFSGQGHRGSFGPSWHGSPAIHAQTGYRGHFGPAPRAIHGPRPYVHPVPAPRFYGPGPGYWAPRWRPAPGFHSGYWHHGWRGGYYGWWWVAGPTWYLYSAPVYAGGVYAVPSEAPLQVIEGGTIGEERSAPTQSTQYWYYCDSPAGYYPYVKECGSEWRPVPAQPVPPPPAGAPAEPPPGVQGR
jgi:hypothetical protein